MGPIWVDKIAIEKNSKKKTQNFETALYQSIHLQKYVYRNHRNIFIFLE